MKYKEITEMNDAELSAKELELGRELLEKRFSHAISQLADTAGLGRTRKDLARVKTEMRMRERGAKNNGNQRKEG